MAIPEKPISRIEHYLARANGQNVTPPDPISRIEHYLAGIAAGVPQELLDDVANLKSQIDQKSPYIIESLTDQPIASFSDGADDAPIRSLVVDIAPVQEGSGDPSPENVRPITGWNAVHSYVIGINRWDGEWESGEIGPDGTNRSNIQRCRSKNYIPVSPDTTIYHTGAIAIVAYDINFTKIVQTGGFVDAGTYRTPNACHYIRFFVNTPTMPDGMSINFPGDDTEFHPYSNYYSTELGMTVYGGTLDVVSGVLTVNKAMVDLGDFDWVSETDLVSGQFRVNQPQIIALGARYSTVSCSILKGVSPQGYSSFKYGEIGLSNSSEVQLLRARAAEFDEATPADVKLFFAGQTLVYELATPQTYQLTPVEVKTLLGQNNVFANTGNVSVEYPADTKMYIDNQITAFTK